MPSELNGGFVTIFNAFHHFRPSEAQGLLEQLIAQKRPFAILEPNDRSLWQLIANTLSLPLLQLLATPFLKPFRWSRLVFTYIFPVIPLVTLWDGWVSVGRTYTAKEIEAMAAQADIKEEYSWKIGRARHPFGYVNYAIGLPLSGRTR